MDSDLVGAAGCGGVSVYATAVDLPAFSALTLIDRVMRDLRGDSGGMPACHRMLAEA